MHFSAPDVSLFAHNTLFLYKISSLREPGRRQLHSVDAQPPSLGLFGFEILSTPLIARLSVPPFWSIFKLHAQTDAPFLSFPTSLRKGAFQ
jgi:hypothetical protein